MTVTVMGIEHFAFTRIHFFSDFTITAVH